MFVLEKEKMLESYFKAWKTKNGNGRDQNDMRFGQVMVNMFRLGPLPEVFYEESAEKAYKKLKKVL